MDIPALLPILIVSIIIVAIFIGFLFSNKAVIKRKLKNAPLKRIYHFRNGEVAKFIGTVEFVDEPLIAPLSGRECSYYYVLIEQKVSTGKSTRWKTIIEEKHWNKFVIRDSSACAMIQFDDTKSYVILDRKFSSGTFNDASNHLEQFLSKHGHQSETFLGFNKTLRYREGILEKDEEVVVAGKGKWMDGSQIGLPNQYDRVLLVSASEKDPVYLTDDPNMTKIDRRRKGSGLRV